MSLWFSTSSLQLSKRFPAGPTIQDVVTVLHDPHQTLQLSANVTAIPDPAGAENNFLITKTIPLFGGLINGWLTFKAKWDNTPDGGNLESDIGFGFTGMDEMRVVEDEAGALYFTENMTIKAPGILMSLIKSQIRRAHAEFHEKLIERVLANRTSEQQ